MKLVACGRCRRHVRPDEACPFCATSMIRGAAVAAALGFSLAACGAPPPPETPVYVMTPRPDLGLELQAPLPPHTIIDNPNVAAYGAPP